MRKIPKHQVGAVLTTSKAVGTVPEIALTGSPAALGAGLILPASAYGLYNIQQHINELNDRAHYSDRNANRMLYNVGASQPRTRTASSWNRGIVLPEVVVTAPRIYRFDKDGTIVDQPEDQGIVVSGGSPIDVDSEDSNNEDNQENDEQSDKPSNKPDKPDKPRTRWERIKEAYRILRDKQAKAEASGKGAVSEEEKKAFLKKWTEGYKNASWLGRGFRILRDIQVLGTGVDAADNIFGAIGEAASDGTRKSTSNWNFTKHYTPLGWLMYSTTAPVDSNKTNTSNNQTYTPIVSIDYDRLNATVPSSAGSDSTIQIQTNQDLRDKYPEAYK